MLYVYIVYIYMYMHSTAHLQLYNFTFVPLKKVLEFKFNLCLYFNLLILLYDVGIYNYEETLNIKYLSFLTYISIMLNLETK